MHSLTILFYSKPYLTYRHDFDYFDYSGINRNVFIYATSKDVFIKDLILRTWVSSTGESNSGGFKPQLTIEEILN